MRAILFFIICINMLGSLPTKAQETQRVMSYNIRNGVGMDSKSDYQRIADVILQAKPDVVALQEIDSVTQRSKGVDVLGEIAKLTSMHSVYAPAISFQGGKYGLGLLAKEKPVSSRYLPLPGSEEARVLLIVEFKDYVVCCTHFSLTETDRLASVAIIHKELAKESKPVFLAGDLNALPDSPVLKALQKQFVPLNNFQHPTYPAKQATKCIDYILGYTGNGQAYQVVSNEVINAVVASDHLPLLTEVRLKACTAL